MQDLRILLYGDGRVLLPGGYSLSKMTQLITEGLKGVANVTVDQVHRHIRDRHIPEFVQGANKLSWGFLDTYHEVWIFGDRQANKADIDVRNAEPYNELDEYERAVLREWMKDRGLMITGDHSEVFPYTPKPCDHVHSQFINLGAAIGRYVPRAHQLRVWDGPPTRCAAPLYDNSNTLDGPDPREFDIDPKLQIDATPQDIVTQPIPHKLFTWVKPSGQIAAITVFPDHQHEGKIREPTPGALKLDSDWPIGSPLPEVVAWGLDKRPVAAGRKYALVSAFDGDSVDVGRIVADSSFHHYIDFNLEGIAKAATGSDGKPTPGSNLDQVAQYFCNLAVWLAPRKTREQIRIDLLSSLPTHPLVQSVRGMDADILGRVARTAAELEVGLANVYRVLSLSSDDAGSPGDLVSTGFAHTTITAASAKSNLSDADRVLGSIVREFHDYFFALGTFSPGPDHIIPAAALVDQGLMKGFRPSNAFRFSKEDDMGMCVAGETWDSFRRGQFDGQFVITQIDAAGNFVGTHDGDRISGNCSNGIIWFHREGSVRRTYSGRFQTPVLIRGAASETAFLDLRQLLPLDDDWVGTHT